MSAHLLDDFFADGLLRLFPEHTRHGSSVVLHTHCMFPTGDHVTINVTPVKNGLTLTDGGGAWEAIIASGVDVSRPSVIRDALIAADSEGFKFAFGEFVALEVSRDTFDGATLSLANFSQAWASRVISRHHRMARNSIEERLIATLIRVYGPDAVSKGGSVLGASTREYGVTATVNLPRARSAIFEAVSSHPVSISAAFTALTDIGKAHSEWPRVVVVKGLQHWASRDVTLLSDCTEGIVDVEQPDRLMRTVQAIAA